MAVAMVMELHVVAMKLHVLSNVVNLTSIGRDPPSLWLEREQLHIQ